jgi:hypothetical protein
MHKGGFCGGLKNSSCGGSRCTRRAGVFWAGAQRVPAWGEPSPPRRPPWGGMRKGGSDSLLPQADLSQRTVRSFLGAYHIRSSRLGAPIQEYEPLMVPCRRLGNA